MSCHPLGTKENAMPRVDSNRAGAFPNARLFVLALGAALTFSGAESSAQGHTSEPHPAATGAAHHGLADLEKTFWVCDHAATVHGVLDMGTAVACAAATRDFRLKRFDGDLNAMLSWWQRNKAHQHQLLDMGYRSAGYR
jgi:hypothetical protein